MEQADGAGGDAQIGYIGAKLDSARKPSISAMV